MVATLSSMLNQKINELITGRKIGITVGVNIEGQVGQRGGELWQIPIIEVNGREEKNISKYSMENGKNYSENTVFEPTVITLRCHLTNGIISQTVSNLALAAQNRLGGDLLSNTVANSFNKLKNIYDNNIVCDITTNIRTYYNLLLKVKPTKEDIENDQNGIFIDLIFQEIQLFKPNTLRLSAPVKKTGSARRKKALKKNIPAQTKDNMKYYKILPDGNYCKCMF